MRCSHNIFKQEENQMKKLFSLALALVLVLSMATVAMASTVDGSGSTTYTDMSQVTITKNYTLTNPGTTSPAETITFTVSQPTITGNDAATAPANLPTVSSIVYQAGDAGTAAKTATITLPTYTDVGIYTYKITENGNNKAGVTYYGTQFTLVVSVVMDETNGKVRVAGVHCEDMTQDGSRKTSEFTNVYSAGSLSVTKNVTGLYGDTNKYFDVKVKLNGEAGKVYESIAVSGGSNSANPTSVTVGEEYTFKLKDDDTITFSNIPYGVTYTVVEADYTSAGYDVASYTFSDSAQKIDSASDCVTITNNKGGSVDTGVALDSLPFILILAVCAGAAVLMTVKRRKSEY